MKKSKVGKEFFSKNVTAWSPWSLEEANNSFVIEDALV